MTRRFSARTRLLVVAIALLAVAATGGREASAQTWAGVGGNNLWITAANWSSGAAPSSGAEIVFDGSSALQLSNVMGGPFTVKSLSFTSAQTQPVTISTGTEQPLSFNTSGTILNVQSGSHTFTGTNSGGTGTPQCWFFSTTGTGINYTYNVDAGAAFTIAGRMGIGGLGTGFFKTGGGLLNLSADNAGTGGWNFNNRATEGFVVQEGVVRWSHNNAKGLTSNVWTVKAGAAIEILGGLASINNGSGVINLSGSGVGGTGALRALGTGTFSSFTSAEVNLVTDAAIGVDSGRLLLPYPIKTPSGTSAFIKLGSGTLQLNGSGTSTFNGGTRLAAGTLIVNNSTSANQVLGTGGLDVLGGTLEIGQTAATASTLPLVAGANVTMSSGAMNFLVGTTFDKITAGGASTFSLTGGTIGLTLSGTFDPLATYSILQGFAAGSVSGLTFSGTFWDPAQYTPSLSSAGVLSFAAVPEPSSLAVVGMSVVGAGYFATRRRSRQG
jgi:autotransporter-associated beta strand protein